MKNNGWILLHRKIQEKGYYTNSQYVHLWFHLLLKANHEEKEWLWRGQVHKAKRGQFITSRVSLSKETGIPQTNIERILKCFEKERQIGQQKTTKNRLITITNYDKYQKLDSKWTTNGQQADTNNELNELKQLKEDTSNSHELLTPKKKMYNYENETDADQLGFEARKKRQHKPIDHDKFRAISALIADVKQEIGKELVEFPTSSKKYANALLQEFGHDEVIKALKWSKINWNSPPKMMKTIFHKLMPDYKESIKKPNYEKF